MFLSNAFRSRVRYVTCRDVASESFIRPECIFVGVVRVRWARIVANVRASPRSAYHFYHFGGEDGDHNQVFQVNDDVKLNVWFCPVNAYFHDVFGRFHVKYRGCKYASAYPIGFVRCFYRRVGIGLNVPSQVEDCLEEVVQGRDRLVEFRLRRRIGGLEEEVSFGVGFDPGRQARVVRVQAASVTFVQAKIGHCSIDARALAVRHRLGRIQGVSPANVPGNDRFICIRAWFDRDSVSWCGARLLPVYFTRGCGC